MTKKKLKQENARLRRLLKKAQKDMVDRCGECCFVCLWYRNDVSDCGEDCSNCHQKCECKNCSWGSKFTWRYAQEV